MLASATQGAAGFQSSRAPLYASSSTMTGLPSELPQIRYSPMLAASLPPRAASCARGGRNSMRSRATYTAAPPPYDQPMTAIRSGLTSGRPGQQCRGHEHVGGAIAGGHGLARAHLAIAARRSTD
jgi:hypothetical protein